VLGLSDPDEGLYSRKILL